jgi:dipeptidyl aminopeptidase/acylaminoacyl peptidase
MFHYHLLDHGRQVLWWSDRTGRGNYYLYDGRTGRLLNRVTQGDRLVAGRIEKIDTIARTIIFQGYGQEEGDPHYTYYYKVNLNGRGQQLLTYGLGDHDLQFSSDGRYAIDQYSRMDMPPVWNVVDISNPKRHYEIFRTSEADCLQAGWVKPTLVKVKAADEQTDLYGVMYLPSDSSLFTLHSSLPIITNVYPGPQDDQIPRRFTVDENGNQALAELGFVVINVQSRGSSPLREKDFYCYGYGNLRDYPLADTRHTIETLAKAYPFIDLDRVGIYGHSGGGFQTVAAMLQDPDFYKVGVAASGNHDNNEYIQWWAETYHGYGKEIPTNMELADRLKGRLLLMTGEVDENVPVASTIRMADALQKAGKRFDLMILPNQGHGLIGDYYLNSIRYYFLEHLVHPETFDIDIVRHTAK